jgi:hypothetical protein
MKHNEFPEAEIVLKACKALGPVLEILVCVLPLGNGGAQVEDPDLPRQALGPRHPPDRHGRPPGHRQLPLLGRPPHAPQLPLRRRLL